MAYIKARFISSEGSRDGIFDAETLYDMAATGTLARSFPPHECSKEVRTELSPEFESLKDAMGYEFP